MMSKALSREGKSLCVEGECSLSASSSSSEDSHISDSESVTSHGSSLSTPLASQTIPPKPTSSYKVGKRSSEIMTRRRSDNKRSKKKTFGSNSTNNSVLHETAENNNRSNPDGQSKKSNVILPMGTYMSEQKAIKFSVDNFQTYLHQFKSRFDSNGETLNLIKALLKFVEGRPNSSMPNLFRSSTTEQTTLGKGKWRDLLEENGFCNWIKDRRLKRWSVLNTKARNFYNWTSLDRKSLFPQFLDFICLFMFLAFKSRGMDLEDKRVSKVAMDYFERQYSHLEVIDYYMELDFLILNLNPTIFHRANEHEVIRLSFAIDEPIRDVTSTAFITMKSYHDLFKEHEEAFTKCEADWKEIVSLSRKISDRAKDLSESNSVYQDLHVHFIRYAQAAKGQTSNAETERSMDFTLGTIQGDELVTDVLDVIKKRVESKGGNISNSTVSTVTDSIVKEKNRLVFNQSTEVDLREDLALSDSSLSHTDSVSSPIPIVEGIPSVSNWCDQWTDSRGCELDPIPYLKNGYSYSVGEDKQTDVCERAIVSDLSPVNPFLPHNVPPTSKLVEHGTDNVSATRLALSLTCVVTGSEPEGNGQEQSLIKSATTQSSNPDEDFNINYKMGPSTSTVNATLHIIKLTESEAGKEAGTDCTENEANYDGVKTASVNDEKSSSSRAQEDGLVSQQPNLSCAEDQDIVTGSPNQFDTACNSSPDEDILDIDAPMTDLW